MNAGIQFLSLELQVRVTERGYVTDEDRLCYD